MAFADRANQYLNAEQPWAANDNYPVPTDLYYGDLDGDWDLDGDGLLELLLVHRVPSVVDELLVRRLFVSGVRRRTDTEHQDEDGEHVRDRSNRLNEVHG